MGPITIVGLDFAKSVSQVHAVAEGAVVVRRQMRRAQVLSFLPQALLGIETCATAHR